MDAKKLSQVADAVSAVCTRFDAFVQKRRDSRSDADFSPAHIALLRRLSKTTGMVDYLTEAEAKLAYGMQNLVQTKTYPAGTEWFNIKTGKHEPSKKALIVGVLTDAGKAMLAKGLGRSDDARGDASPHGKTNPDIKKSPKDADKTNNLMNDLHTGNHTRPYAVLLKSGERLTYYTKNEAQEAFDLLQTARNPNSRSVKIETGKFQIK